MMDDFVDVTAHYIQKFTGRVGVIEGFLLHYPNKGDPLHVHLKHEYKSVVADFGTVINVTYYKYLILLQTTETVCELYLHGPSKIISMPILKDKDSVAKNWGFNSFYDLKQKVGLHE
jgi:hypothetical protein